MDTYQEFLTYLVNVQCIHKVMFHRRNLTASDIKLIKKLPLGIKRTYIDKGKWNFVGYVPMSQKWFVYLGESDDDIQIYNRELILLFINYVQLGLDWETIKQIIYVWVTEHEEY